MAFEEEIKLYESLRCKYQALIINKMDREEYTPDFVNAPPKLKMVF